MALVGNALPLVNWPNPEFVSFRSANATTRATRFGISTATCRNTRPTLQKVDRPIAGLLSDLKQRGLLEDTLVWWGGEFGRTPFSQSNNGRDHNPKGFTVWLAGGGVKPGFAHGATDEFGFQAVENKVHMHDLHATILWALGLDHEQLTFHQAGRDFRLTDIHGKVVHEIFA